MHVSFTTYFIESQKINWKQKLIKGNKTHRIIEAISHKVQDAVWKNLKKHVNFSISLCGKKDEELVALKTTSPTSSKLVIGKIFKNL
jgi:hypothetical protein